MTLKHDYDFANEGDFQDALAGRGELAAMRDGFIADLKQGDKMVVHVPGQPDRALVLREKLEVLLGQKLTGQDVYAIPFDL